MSSSDARTVKSLLSISKFGGLDPNTSLPPVAAELYDAHKLPVARSAYPGGISLIPADTLISRLLAQNIRHRGLSFLYAELLSHNEGNQIYIRELSQLSGFRIETLHPLFQNAVLMGVLRHSEEGMKPFLNPPGGFTVENGDRFVFLAGRYEDTLPSSRSPLPALERHPTKGGPAVKSGRKVLVLGWNRKVPALMNEFNSYREERFDIDIVSLLPVSERLEQSSRHAKNLDPVRVNHLYGDYTALDDLSALRPHVYDNILLVSSDRLDTGEEADARTISGYVLLRDLLAKTSGQPDIILELMDPENEALFEKRNGEVLITPLILSRILAHVALRPELNIVFDELFTTGGAEVYFRPAAEYGISTGKLRFEEIQGIVAGEGDTALGIRKTGNIRNSRGGIELNPPGSDMVRINAGDEIVVLTTYI